MARFTVMGAGGFIGTHLVRRLRGLGHEVLAPARDRPLPRRDLGHVAYCIGLTADYLQRPFDTVEAHVSLFSRVLREAAFDSLVYLSSTRLYDSGGAHGREDNDLILNPANPRHLYDFSKGLGESLCRVSGRDNVRAARLSCVYADDLSAETFLHDLLRDSLGGGHLTVEAHPDGARDYIHVDDVCRAVVEIAVGGTRPIYNVACGANVSNRELFALVERHTGCRISATAPPAGGTDHAPLIDVGALRADFGLSPRRLQDALPCLVAANRPQPAARAAVR